MSPFPTDEHGNITATGKGIELYRLIMLKHRLALEVNSGLGFRLPTAPAVRDVLNDWNAQQAPDARLPVPRSKAKLLEVYSKWLDEHGIAPLTEDPA